MNQHLYLWLFDVGNADGFAEQSARTLPKVNGLMVAAFYVRTKDTALLKLSYPTRPSSTYLLRRWAERNGYCVLDNSTWDAVMHAAFERSLDGYECMADSGFAEDLALLALATTYEKAACGPVDIEPRLSAVAGVIDTESSGLQPAPNK